MFADDICVFCQVCEGCKIHLCVRLMQNRMELFSIAAKLYDV